MANDGKIKALRMLKIGHSITASFKLTDALVISRIISNDIYSFISNKTTL